MLRHTSKSSNCIIATQWRKANYLQIQNNSSTPATITEQDRSKDTILARNTAVCSPHFESN